MTCTCLVSNASVRCPSSVYEKYIYFESFYLYFLLFCAMYLCILTLFVVSGICITLTRSNSVHFNINAKFNAMNCFNKNLYCIFPRISWIDDITGWTGLESYEKIKWAAEDRNRWKSIVVNLLKEDDTS